jgi:N-acetylglutamate synthase-like GNAT family acetyltransferase
VREVVDSADPAVALGHRVLRRIFPKTELVGLAEWRESLREREAGLWTDIQWHLLVAEVDGEVIGVAAGTYLGNVNTGVIGYLAIAPPDRHHGIGPRLRARLRALFQRDARRIRGLPLQAVFGEVRRDNPWLRTLARRNHVLALDINYLQPGLHQHEHPLPLVCYYESLDRPRRRLPVPVVRRLLYTIWRRVYRIARPMSDPAFRRMLRDLSGRRWIGPLRLGVRPASPSGH